jgi:ABC-type transport system involved in multi-copper enzyme maturation permease subunit
MRATLSLFHREFAAYFTGPIGYVAMFGFLVLTGLQFNLALTLLNESGPRGVEYPMQVLLGGSEIAGPAQTAGVLFWGLFPAVTGIITMRLLAEERGTGTLEMLLTAPIRDWQVVLAKFAACFAFYLVLWLPTLAYLPVLLNIHAEWREVNSVWTIMIVGGIAAMIPTLLLMLFNATPWAWLPTLIAGAACLAIGWYCHLENDPEKLLTLTFGIDPYPALTSYLGIILAGAMFLSLGLFVSSLVKSQLVAWMLALLLGLVFVLPALLRWWFDTGSPGYRLVYFISVPEHFRRDFTRGILDTRPLVLYASVTLLCLFLTVRSLEARRLK